MSSFKFPISLGLSVAFLLARSSFAEAPVLPGVGAAMQEMVAKNEIAGAVTVVVAKDEVLHLECTGAANVAGKRPMTPETIFWIASMTKPITGTAVLMLQDEGKLKVSDPVAKYLPEFATLKTPSGKPASSTRIAQRWLRRCWHWIKLRPGRECAAGGGDCSNDEHGKSRPAAVRGQRL